MFVTTAFVANVVVRDDDTGFGPIIRSTPITRLQYLGGRFAGAVAAAALAFLFIPLGVWIGSLMPWVDAETLGPNRLAYYAYGFLVFGAAEPARHRRDLLHRGDMTRSMMWTYVAVIVFFLAWLILIGIAAGEARASRHDGADRAVRHRRLRQRDALLDLRRAQHADAGRSRARSSQPPDLARRRRGLPRAGASPATASPKPACRRSAGRKDAAAEAEPAAAPRAGRGPLPGRTARARRRAALGARPSSR